MRFGDVSATQMRCRGAQKRCSRLPAGSRAADPAGSCCLLMRRQVVEGLLRGCVGSFGPHPELRLHCGRRHTALAVLVAASNSADIEHALRNVMGRCGVRAYTRIAHA